MIGATATNRNDFRELARLRLEEAHALMAEELWAGAYCQAGLAVECALKACIARRTVRFSFPPTKQRIERIYSHNLENLVREAGLWTKFESEMRATPRLSDNWAIVKDWSIEARYNVGVAQTSAQELMQAVTEPKTGVLPWVRRHW